MSTLRSVSNTEGQYPPPRRRFAIKDSKPLPPLPGNIPTNANIPTGPSINTRRPTREQAYIGSSFKTHPPIEPGTPSVQADNVRRAAAATARLKADRVNIWNVSSIDGKGKKKPGALGIGDGMIYFASEADNGPVRTWTSLSVISVSIDSHNYMHINLGASGSLEFWAGSNDEADAILSKVQRSKRLAFGLEPPPPSPPLRVAVAMCDYEADGEDELTVKQGEMLTVIDKEKSNEWPNCRNLKGKEGLIESTDEAEDNAAAEAARAEAARKEQEQAAEAAAKAKRLADKRRQKWEQEARKAQKRQELVATALDDFEADGYDELTVMEDEMLIVINREESDGWWKCRNLRGKEGLVPAAYLVARIGSDAEAEAARAEFPRMERQQAASAAIWAKSLADASRQIWEEQAREAQERRERQEAEAKEAEAQRQKEELRGRAREAGWREGETRAHTDIISTTHRVTQNSMLLDPFPMFAGAAAKSMVITSENEDRVVEPNATAQPELGPDPVSELSSWSVGPSESTFSKFGKEDSCFIDQSLALNPQHSTFSETMVLVDDIGISITWISPMPVKVNGHFCDVFEGMHAEVGKVALKRPRIDSTGYDDVAIRRFEREAATWRNLRHPHILKFLGTFRRDGHIYFVSPFINNGTLVEYIAARPATNRIRLLSETADAIQYLHTEGIVHGDLKASNILIEDDGSCLLCDFGLTRTVESRTSTALRGAGTFRWQSPELWDNAPKSFESDVYAFGMTIAE
ncbi:hypothetical protein FS837_011622, partial [Tulasnella sp. UAMH 9824]